MLGKCQICRGDHHDDQCPERRPKSRFEATILYDHKHQPLLATYAESMGWALDEVNGAWCVLSMAATKEHYSIEDVQSAIAFFESEGAQPVSFKVTRVVYDSALGIDELEVEDA